MESARWLSRLRWWLTRPPLLKGAAALAVVCAMAFALGQGAAALQASTLATQPTQDAQGKRPMSAPLAAEQVSAAQGILPTIVSPDPSAPAAAPPTQVAFTTSAHPSTADGEQQRPQTDQAPLKHAGKGAGKGAKQHGGDHGAQGNKHGPGHGKGKSGGD